MVLQGILCFSPFALSISDAKGAAVATGTTTKTTTKAAGIETEKARIAKEAARIKEAAVAVAAATATTE